MVLEEFHNKTLGLLGTSIFLGTTVFRSPRESPAIRIAYK